MCKKRKIREHRNALVFFFPLAMLVIPISQKLSLGTRSITQWIFYVCEKTRWNMLYEKSRIMRAFSLYKSQLHTHGWEKCFSHNAFATLCRILFWFNGVYIFRDVFVHYRKMLYRYYITSIWHGQLEKRADAKASALNIIYELLWGKFFCLLFL